MTLCANNHLQLAQNFPSDELPPTQLLKSFQIATWISEVIIRILLMEKAKPMDEQKDHKKKKHLNQDLMHWSQKVLQSPESAKYLGTFSGNGQTYRLRVNVQTSFAKHIKRLQVYSFNSLSELDTVPVILLVMVVNQDRISPNSTKNRRLRNIGA